MLMKYRTHILTALVLIASTISVLLSHSNCAQMKSQSLNPVEQRVQQSEAERLNLPEHLFVEPTRVRLDDDYFVSTFKLARIEGELVFVPDSRFASEQVSTQANIGGNYWSE